MGQIKVDCDQGTNLAFSGNLLSSMKCPATDISILACISSESYMHMHLLVQAQTLIRKNALYENINQEINGLLMFQPTVFAVLPFRTTDYKDCEEDDGQDLPLLSFHRDVAIDNLRFLSIFYNTGPNSFFVATNLLDRLLSRILVARKALPIVATCCFYLATCYTNASSIPIDLDDLMKLTQCETTRDIFQQVANHIRDEVGFCRQRPVTPLSFLELFYDVFMLQDELLRDCSVKAFLISRLELLCQFDFTKFRYDLLALAFLHYFLQQIGFLSDSKQLTVLELQFYCRMDEDAYRECYSMIERYTVEYETRATKRPKLRLTWTISRRLLLKRRPSLLVRSNLEPVMEEESSCETSWAIIFPSDDESYSKAFKGKASDDDSFPGSHQQVTEETESGNENSSSDYQSEGCEEAVSNLKMPSDSVFLDGERNAQEQESYAKYAASIMMEISSGAPGDESSNQPKSDEDVFVKAEGCDDEMENERNFDESDFSINEPCMPEMNSLNDLVISEDAEKHEWKTSSASLLDLEPISKLLVPADDDTPKSFESLPLIVEGEINNKLVVDNTFSADESYLMISGSGVLTADDTSSSKVTLFSDDNNNCIMGII